MTGSESFELAVLDGHGVLVDGRDGRVVVLNGTATHIWQLHLQGCSADECVRMVEQTFGISGSQARQDVELALKLEGQSPAGGDDPYHFESRGGCHVLSWRGQTIFEVAADGRAMRYAHVGVVRRPELRAHLLSIAPKLLALQGCQVLHASAVRIGDEIIVISGPSGAGKTTTARALVAAGAQPISEDKLVLNGDGAAVLTAESRLVGWVDGTAAAIDREIRDVNCRSLADVACGDSVPLGRIALLEAGARSIGSSLEFRPVTRAEATAALLVQTFVATTDRDVWNRNLARAIALTKAPAYRLHVPTGLAALETAAIAYISKMTS